MKLSGKTEKLEAIGFINVEGVNFDIEISAEETVTFLKQILPLAREFKSLRIFETEKDNADLCNKLNKTREEHREMERERDHAKAKEDYLIKKSNEMEEEIRELKEQLKEANLKAKLK